MHMYTYLYMYIYVCINMFQALTRGVSLLNKTKNWYDIHVHVQYFCQPVRNIGHFGGNLWLFLKNLGLFWCETTLKKIVVY